MRGSEERNMPVNQHLVERTFCVTNGIDRHAHCGNACACFGRARTVVLFVVLQLLVGKTTHDDTEDEESDK